MCSETHETAGRLLPVVLRWMKETETDRGLLGQCLWREEKDGATEEEEEEEEAKSESILLSRRRN